MRSEVKNQIEKNEVFVLSSCSCPCLAKSMNESFFPLLALSSIKLQTNWNCNWCGLTGCLGVWAGQNDDVWVWFAVEVASATLNANAINVKCNMQNANQLCICGGFLNCFRFWIKLDWRHLRIIPISFRKWQIFHLNKFYNFLSGNPWRHLKRIICWWWY